MSRSPQSRNDGSFDRRQAWALIVLSVAIALVGIVVGTSTVATAQSNPFATCNIGGFRNARIAWGDVERALAAPDASADVVEALTAELRTVYRADGSMDMHALEALLTPKLHQESEMDCSQIGTAPAPGAPIAQNRLAYLDQVRQVDAQTVSAFMVLPGRMFQAAPGATPEVVGGEFGPTGATPYPGSVVVDAVQFAIFVNQDGVWKLDYLSFGSMVVFSDVAPIGQAPSDGFIGSWGYSAADLREHGMPSVPEGSEVVASPVASPIASPAA